MELKSMTRTPFTVGPCIGLPLQTTTTSLNFLLQRGTNVNALKDEKVSPLSTAITNGHLAMIELLAQYGATFEKLGGMRESPLELAYRWPAAIAVRLLLKMGADVNSDNVLI